MITVTLKDGSKREYENNTTVAEVAKSISGGLFRNICCARVDGKVVDMRTALEKDCELEILTFDDPDGKKAYRHTASHILAQAVKRLYPEVKLAIGPSIDNGFYYDFDTDKPFLPEELEKIEKEMAKIIKEGIPLEHFELSKEEAVKLMADEPYKLELIEEHAKEGDLSFYKQGDFVDLCAGPHMYDTSKIKAFKLTQCTGAYWRGNSDNKMLQRIYGTAFSKKEDLEAYLTAIEEAKKRDHRKIGKELDLFDIYDEGPGFPFFFPKGMVLRNILENFWREEHAKNGYQEIKTPIILNKELWLRSGHWDHYKDNMYTTDIDDAEYAVKPMNCPGGMLAFKRKMYSYRNLPARMAELGLVHRHELSGALHGLMRVRCFTQDDAHIFMTPEQIESEILGVITMIDKFYSIFGFEYALELSTRPEDSMGSDEQWEMATEALKKALDKNGKTYKINEGDGAFYGPKIDFHLTDCIGRTWQCGTIQLDFQMPERFDLTYIGKDNEKHRPVMIHRVIFGSIERFIAILTEHFAGAFPTWLAPVQVKIIPIADRHMEYVEKLEKSFEAAGIRYETDARNEKVGYKIREAQLEKAPYMLVIGDKEMEQETVSIRARKGGDLVEKTPEEFIAELKEEIASKAR